MKIKRFRVDGVPKGYSIHDIDLTPSGAPVAIVQCGRDRMAVSYAIVGGRCLELPGGGYRSHHIRSIDEERFVVVKRRTVDKGEQNLWLYSSNGQVTGNFRVGDAIDEVVARNDELVIFYGDEAPGGGMAVFGMDGSKLWNSSHFPPGERLQWWFNGACLIDDSTVGVFGTVFSPNLEERYFRINLQNRTQILQPRPRRFIPTTISVRRELVYAYGFSDEYGETALHAIREWNPRTGTIRDVGTYPISRVHGTWKTLRGLPGGRFIAPTTKGYRIISLDD